jgi:hypothetical protein
MGFLAPWFLAGAAVTALPLWLHLLRRYRSEPQPFSSLMFFEPRTQSSVRHRRLRYLLLLALRLGLLLLLALAFADPFVSTPPAGLSDQHVLVLALDRSFSMRYGDHMRRAKDLALQRLLRWPENGAVRVLALDSEAVFLTGAAAGRAEIRSAIAGLEAGDRGTSYAALVRALRGAAESLHRPLEVHLFSDLQQTAMPAVFADLQLPPGTRLILEGAPAKAEENWAVEAVAAPSRLFDSKKRRVSATVAGYHTPESRRTVSLVLDGRVLETKSMDIPAGGRATVEFSSLESPYGMHRGEVRLNSADLLPQDDRFPFAVERAEPRRVLFLHPGGRSRAAFYYAAALAASGTSGFAAEPLPVDQASGARFASYAFVVLSDTGALSRTVESALRDYVSGGGGLLIALGSNGARAGKAPVTGQVIDGEMRPRGFETAVAAGGGQGALRGVALEQVKFFSAARIDEARGTVIARLEDGTPLLLEQPLGAGKVLTFASGLGNVSNDGWEARRRVRKASPPARLSSCMLRARREPRWTLPRRAVNAPSPCARPRRRSRLSSRKMGFMRFAARTGPRAWWRCMRRGRNPISLPCRRKRWICGQKAALPVRRAMRPIGIGMRSPGASDAICCSWLCSLRWRNRW